jgi:glycosyltransferase involved in cell wall biosynthesis
MKIAYLITKSNWGGAQRYVYDLALSSKKEGHDVIVCAGGDGRLFEECAEAGIKTRKLHSSQRDINVFKELKLLFEINAFIREEKPDVLHLNSSKLGGLGAFAGRLLGVRNVVFTAHGWPFKEDVNILKKGLMYFFSWLTAVFAHNIITPSEDDFVKGKNMPFVSRKMFYIPHGRVLREVYEKQEARNFLKNIIEIPEDKVWVGVNAELHKNKGHVYLLEAFVDVDAYLVLMSSGEERNNLEKKVSELGISDKVFFLGYVPDGARYMKAFDLLALPSLKEGLPYVLLEAGILGLPVVASRVGGIPEIVGDAELLVEPKDVAGLKEAIIGLVPNEAKRVALGRDLYERVSTKYSFENMITKTLGLYKS